MPDWKWGPQLGTLESITAWKIAWSQSQSLIVTDSIVTDSSIDLSWSLNGQKVCENHE